MLKYLIRGKKNPQTKKVKYYAQLAPVTPIGMAQIAARIEKRCTVSTPDVKAVLNALQTEVIYLLQLGHSVRLGDLGSFRPTISSTGVETVAEAHKKGAELIRKVNVRFTKGGEIREAFRLANVSFAAQRDVTNTKA